MKPHHACATAFALLFILIIGTIFFARFLDNTVNEILLSLDKFPEEALLAEKNAAELQSFWEGRRRTLSFTLSDSSLNSISLLFDELNISIKNCDNEEYQKTTARLKRAVESIKQLEMISLSNIF